MCVCWHYSPEPVIYIHLNINFLYRLKTTNILSSKILIQWRCSCFKAAYAHITVLRLHFSEHRENFITLYGPQSTKPKSFSLEQIQNVLNVWYFISLFHFFLYFPPPSPSYRSQDKYSSPMYRGPEGERYAKLKFSLTGFSK